MTAERALLRAGRPHTLPRSRQARGQRALQSPSTATACLAAGAPSHPCRTAAGTLCTPGLSAAYADCQVDDLSPPCGSLSSLPAGACGKWRTPQSGECGAATLPSCQVVSTLRLGDCPGSSSSWRARPLFLQVLWLGTRCGCRAGQRLLHLHLALPGTAQRWGVSCTGPVMLHCCDGGRHSLMPRSCFHRLPAAVQRPGRAEPVHLLGGVLQLRLPSRCRCRLSLSRSAGAALP